MSERAAELAARRPRAEYPVELTEKDRASFDEHGFVRLERITSDEELGWLVEVYDWLFGERMQAVKGGYFDLARPYDSEGSDLLPQIIAPEAALPALRETAFWRNGHALAAQLLGADPAKLHGWGHMILKPARVGEALPWHQDEAYWDPAFDYRALGCWMTLDEATPESGCLRFLPGSHRGDVRVHRHIDDDPKVHGLVTDDADESQALDVPVPAAGALLHHCRMVHASNPNRASFARRGYANEWQLRPLRREVPYARPWVAEGKRAWESRAMFGDAQG